MSSAGFHPASLDPAVIEPHAQGSIVRIIAKPGRRAGTGVLGVQPAADGRPALVVALHAPAQEGRANAELLAVLAEYLNLPKTQLRLVSGAQGKLKRVLVPKN